MSVPTQSRTHDDDGGAPAFERVPPGGDQDGIDAEQSVLGGMMLTKTAIEDVADLLTGADFYRPAHQTIHAAITDLYGRGEPADAVTVAAHLARTGDLARAGGAPYLHTLIARVPTAAHARYYARIIRDNARLRRLVEAGTRIVQMGYTADGGVDETIDAAQAELAAVRANAPGQGMDRVKWLDDVIEDYLRAEEGEAAPTLPLPYTDLDACLRPEPGDLIVIAARPGVGKSTVCLDIARHVAIEHRRPVFVSTMEMPARQLLQRILAAEGRIPLHHIKNRCVDAAGLARRDDAIARIAGSPLVIDDGAAATLTRLRARLRWLEAQDKKPAAVVVDYVQIMKAEIKSGNRTNEVDALARGLKEIAMEFETVVVAAAQLNRQATQRTEKRPVLSDLRESGEIEQAANAVVMLHRQDMYEEESPRAGEMDLIVEKNRQGARATITVAYQGHYARAVDMQ